MKALTIKQPWAELIVNGYKNYEFRSWKTSYRGKILIHAGLGIDKDYINTFVKYNLNYEKGAIIGEAIIEDCILVDEKFNDELSKKNCLVYHYDYIGLYAWKLKDIKKYDTPINCKGKLSLWDYNK